MLNILVSADGGLWAAVDLTGIFLWEVMLLPCSAGLLVQEYLGRQCRLSSWSRVLAAEQTPLKFEAESSHSAKLYSNCTSVR